MKSLSLYDKTTTKGHYKKWNYKDLTDNPEYKLKEIDMKVLIMSVK